MGKIGAPYLVIHENTDGSKRFYFAPRQDDRQRDGRQPGRMTIRSARSEIHQCRRGLQAVAEIQALARREPDTAMSHDKPGPRRRATHPQGDRCRKAIQGGQIGAMVADYMDHDATCRTPRRRGSSKIYLISR
jgi:hypothetical protein